MVVYQQSSRLFYYSHADNEYLQLVAEGGLPLVLPMAVALLATLWQIVERLYEDRSALFWIRAGATCGLVAVAVQSVWENGLRLPANAVLFAIVAALALHEPHTRHSHKDPPDVAPKDPPNHRLANRPHRTRR
jgi:O-antigen ligase